MKKSKNSIRSLIPRFNAQRMVMDYVRDYYGPASRQQRRMTKDSGEAATDLARWKRKVAKAWPQAKIERVDETFTEIESGDTLPITVAAHLDGLSPEDVRVECLVGLEGEYGDFEVKERHGLTPQEGKGEDGTTLFHLDLQPSLPGLQYYELRIVPFHPDLAHPQETGRMIWL